MKLHKLLLLLLIATIYLTTLAWAGADYYKILGLTKKANEKEIKKAYRKLSMKYHPDTNGGSADAGKKFQEVSQAYEVLSDKDKRKIYDIHGEEGLNKHLQQQQQQGAGGGHDPFDIFSQFFGGRGRPQHKEAQRGPDVHMTLAVTLEDLYNGRNFELEVEQQVLCSHCRGSGAESDDDVHVCTKCKGQGVVMQVQQIAPGFVQQMQSQCPVCGGKGKVTTKQCHKCSGKKREVGHRTLDVYVEQGMKDGHNIEFPGSADEQPDVNSGHVIITLKQLGHMFYTRDGNDLRCTVEITLKESLTGFERYLTHLDGHKVLVKRSSITRPNSTIKINGEGFIDEEATKGFLHVKIVVKFPDVLTTEQQAMVAKLF